MAGPGYVHSGPGLPAYPLKEKDRMTDDATVRADNRNHVFHSWAAQGSFEPLPIAGALGSWFWDYSGKRYLDFSSQLVNVNIGHQHPKLVAAIHEYAGKLTTRNSGSGAALRGRLATIRKFRIVRLACAATRPSPPLATAPTFLSAPPAAP